MKVMRIGVDLAKNAFQIHGVDCHEKPVWRQRLPRDLWLQALLEKVEPGCEIGMEICGGSIIGRGNSKLADFESS